MPPGSIQTVILYKMNAKCNKSTHFPGGRTCFSDIWIFAKFLTGLHRVFVNPSFQDPNGSHIMYWNMIILNPSRFKVEPHSKYCYFCIEIWDLLSLRFSENAVLFHIEWLCRKTAGNVNRPPYRYTGWLTEHVLHRLALSKFWSAPSCTHIYSFPGGSHIDMVYVYVPAFWGAISHNLV